MHDPMTVAHEVKIPLFFKRENQWLKSKKKEWQFYGLATIWHVDPCRGPGGDDSCGWFMRAYHGNQEVLEKIVKRFEFDWDREFKSDSGKTYFTGYFYPENAGAGMPNMGVSAVVLNLFFLAIGEYFESDGCTNWKKSRKWMQKHLFDILLFAENPTDSLRDEIIRKWGTDSKREDRIRSVASCIYGWILREQRPWWKHPRWHIHHWKIQIHFMLALKRWLFSKCNKCGKRFRFGESPCTANWNSSGPRWFRGETDIYHHGCDSITNPQ